MSLFRIFRTPVIVLLLALGAAGALAQETVEICLAWTPSPQVDDEGYPLAEAVRYELWATKNQGAQYMMANVVDDTCYTVSVECGVTYKVRVIGFDAEGRESVPSPWSDAIYYEEGGGLTGADDLPASGAAIRSTYPNPFNPLIRVRYAVSREDDGDHLQLAVLDVRGRVVRTLVDGAEASGEHERVWDGTDASGRRMPSGSYFVRLLTRHGQQIRPITMVK